MNDNIKNGLHFDLPAPEYHGHQGSLSVTGAKVLLKAPALYKWQRENPVHKDVFDFGSAAHAVVLGSGMDEIYVAPFDDWRTKAAQSERAAARDAGLSPVLAKQWEAVCDMAEALLSHPLAAQLLTEGQPEVSAFCPDPETGILRRSRFDWHEASGILVDYKTAACAEPEAFARSAAKYDYHMQAAWYLDIATDLQLNPSCFRFIAQEKEPPYLVSVVGLTPMALEAGRERNRRALDLFRNCTESGKWPGYSTEVVEVDLPVWAYPFDEEIEVA